MRLIVIGPVPPPYHGVAVSTRLVLQNVLLRERFEVEHLDTTDPRSLHNINTWDTGNLVLGLRNSVTLARRLLGKRGLLYLPLSQGAPGFLRDSVFIHLARLARWPVVIHLRGSEFREFYEASNGVLRIWIRLTLRQVVCGAVMGHSVRDVFHGLIPDERISVIPNGTPDLSPERAIRDPETVVFLSNLRRRKGIVESVEAAVQVIRQRPSARFLFVGSWESVELEHDLRERASEVDGAIRFLPATSGEEKRALLLSSSVFLFPPVEPEGHPRVVVEAISAGLPVVTTNRGAIAETVVDGVSGFVLDDPVPEQLAERVLLLLEDEELRSRMSTAARARYLEHFTQEHADRRLAQLLVKVATARDDS
jgi:glycosyltransferase involved in cell wall biosynthesis